MKRISILLLMIGLVLAGEYGVEIEREGRSTLSIETRFPFLEIFRQDEHKIEARLDERWLGDLIAGRVKFRVISGPEGILKPAPGITEPVGPPDPLIAAMLEWVSADSIERWITELQAFQTRFELTPQQEQAGEYLYGLLSGMGYEPAYDPYSFGTVDLYDLALVSPNAAWAVGYGWGGDGVILSSTDGGLHWEAQESGVEAYLYGVDFVDLQHGWAVGDEGIILYTEDGGVVWQPQESPTSRMLLDVCFVDAQHGWAVGDGGIILHTEDGGLTWTQQSSTTSYRLRGLDFLDTEHGWAVGKNGIILYTDDGGDTWVPQVSGTTSYIRQVDFVDPQHGWAVGEGRVILHTQDGGNTWGFQTPPPGAGDYLRDVSFSDLRHGWIVDYEGRVLSTSDGGDEWLVQYSHTGWSARLLGLECLDSLTVLVVGVDGMIIRTDDGGGTWTTHRSGLPDEYRHDSKNIVVELWGEETPELEYIICAHYDSYSSDPYNLAPGANDNGSGCAAVLEAARICKDYGFKSTIKFLLVSGEELGMMGSDHYAWTARERGDDIGGVINGDMIGYPIYGTMRTAVGSYLVPISLLDSVGIYNERYGIGLQVYIYVDNTGASDYGPFAEAGYDALDFAEGTAWEIWGGLDPYYHTTNDLYEHLDPDLLVKITQLELATLAELASPTSGGVQEPLELIPPGPITIWPNPARGEVEIQLSTTSGQGAAGLTIYDAAGRLITTLTVAPSLRWNGCDHQGRPVPAGVYFCSVGKEVRKFILMR